MINVNACGSGSRNIVISPLCMHGESPIFHHKIPFPEKTRKFFKIISYLALGLNQIYDIWTAITLEEESISGRRFYHFHTLEILSSSSYCLHKKLNFDTFKSSEVAKLNSLVNLFL